MKRLSIPLILILPLIGAPAIAADFESCNFETNSGTLSTNWEQIGPAACATFCAAEDGCTAWLYTPHNFSPKTAPGECRTYAEASGKRAPDSSAPNQFCGMIDG